MPPAELPDSNESVFQLSGWAKGLPRFSLRDRAWSARGSGWPVGSGKSTVFALLQALLRRAGWQIRINGEDIKHVAQESLRPMAIALLPQDVCMFHRSVLENVRYGRPEANDEEVMEAMVAARCVDFVEELGITLWRAYDHGRTWRQIVSWSTAAHSNRPGVSKGRPDSGARSPERASPS